MKTSLLVLILTVAAGCGVSPPIEGRNDPYRPPQVQFTDNGLRNNTAVGEIKLSRDAADILFVTVPIRATGDDSFDIDWRITFFDANGRKMSETGWAHHMLNGNTFEYITANSLSAGAKDFQMDLRYAQ